MRSGLIAAAVLAVLFIPCAAPGEGPVFGGSGLQPLAKSPMPIGQLLGRPVYRQIMLHFRICERDSNEGKGADATKVLFQSRIVMLQGRPFSWQSGREVVVPDGSTFGERIHVGHQMQGRFASASDGQYLLNLTFSETAVDDQVEREVRVNAESTKTALTFKIGDTKEVPLGRHQTSGKHRWLELRAENAS